MKCPYAVTRQAMTRTKFEYDAEGKQTGYTAIDKNNAFFIDCLKEDCGAYNSKKQKCEYRG